MEKPQPSDLDPTSLPPETPTQPRSVPVVPRGPAAWQEDLVSGAARGVAAFVSIFSLLNILNALVTDFDADYWWIGFSPFPEKFGQVLLFVASIWILSYALAPRGEFWRRRAATISIEALMVFVVWNIIEYYLILARKKIYSGPWIPFSAVVLVALAFVWSQMRRRNDPPVNTAITWFSFAGSILLCTIVFPLGQMIIFGITDYRRPCDVAIVFGARVKPDGSASQALADRVALGVELYKQKDASGNRFAKRLIFTGGKGADEPVNEVIVMRKLAIEAGVKSDDILLDPNGIDTAHSIENCIPLLDKIGMEENANLFQTRRVSVMVVSHFYHLPRIKMTYQNRRVFTVPVHEPLVKTPIYMAREVLALWEYYFNLLGYRR